MRHRYGWRPDPEDSRDMLFKVRRRIMPEYLPAIVDHRDKVSKIYDQGRLGSCVGHGVGSLDRFVTEQQKLTPFEPSRLFIYYEARKRIGTINEYSGAHIRDAIKAIAREGVCREELWPYQIQDFTKKPSDECYQDAETHQAIEYDRLDNDLTDLRICLYNGFPIVFGMSVYEYFEGPEMAKYGKLNMPKKKDEFLGGHCVLCVGYDDEKEMFIIQNSWGENWGLKGFFEMPYKYMQDDRLVNDLWTIRTVE